MIGQRFGRLTISSYAGVRTRKRLWRCVCDCGGSTITTTGDLRSGTSASCGCLQRERTGSANRTHGLSSDDSYSSWRTMWRRCTDPHDTSWSRYGGRGIRVCESWRDPLVFLADMGPRPDGTSVDRIDGDGNYEPANCRWATRTEQARNTRRAVLLTDDQRAMCPADWARKFGVSRSTISRRFASFGLRQVTVIRELDLAEIGLVES